MFWRGVEQVQFSDQRAPGTWVFDCSLAWSVQFGVSSLHRLEGTQKATEGVRNQFGSFAKKTAELTGTVAGVRDRLDNAKPPKTLTVDAQAVPALEDKSNAGE